MNKMIVIVIVVLLIGAGVYFAVNNNSSTPPSPTTSVQQNEQSTNTTEGQTEGAETETENVKTFDIDGENFKFSLSEIRVKEGDTVKINFHNKVGFHDWVIDEFNAKTKQIQAGQSETIEFVANKKGTFEYYCSVGQHRANGMKGNLIVE